jgi:hypothetical protein
MAWEWVPNGAAGAIAVGDIGAGDAVIAAVMPLTLALMEYWL